MTQNQLVQADLFSYSNLDPETRIVVQQRTEELKTMFRRTAEEIVQIGRKLNDVRDRLRNGQFENWLRQEFDMSRRTAYNFINVFEQFGSANFAQLDIAASALYVLAAPSTTEEARQEALQRAGAGEAVTHSTARQIVTDHKPPRYCAACGEQIAGDVQGKYCAGDHCKYQQTLRQDLQQAASPHEAVVSTAGDVRGQPQAARRCRVCGCTDDHACEGGCYWVEADLCSQCAAKAKTPTDLPPVGGIQGGQATVVTVPSTEPPAPPPPRPATTAAAAPKPDPEPAKLGKVVSTGAPVMQSLPPKPAPVMRPIQSGPKATVISIRVLPGAVPLAARQIMAAIADEGDFPRTMEGGTFANLHDIVDRICTAFFADELSGGDSDADDSSVTVEGQVLASEPIA